MLTQTISAGATEVSPERKHELQSFGSPQAREKFVHCFQPLEDPRWDRFVASHPRASAFHSSPWLRALNQTYGYEPIAYTTTPRNRELENSVVFCQVDSWLTGRRLVSLPFSDHCDALADSHDTQAIMARVLNRELESKRWRYVEVRPLQIDNISTRLHCTRVAYCFHRLDLRPDIDTLFRNLHQNSAQRKILRAQREGLTYREGNTEDLLDHFYGLFQKMRQRRNVPPQSRVWFSNLVRCFGDSLRIRVAFDGNRAVAAMITIRFKDTLMYKYGCSDPRFNRLGGMHLLFWQAIQEAKTCGLRWFDFGRTDADQQGLITFKNRWGAAQSALTYCRYGQAVDSTHFFDLSTGGWKTRATKSILSWLPASVVSKVGQVLYQHVG
jgi:CelD/BcsL family acetyltransferase involved in cellulose biosynthesis